MNMIEQLEGIKTKLDKANARVDEILAENVWMRSYLADIEKDAAKAQRLGTRK